MKTSSLVLLFNVATVTVQLNIVATCLVVPVASFVPEASTAPRLHDDQCYMHDPKYHPTCTRNIICRYPGPHGYPSPFETAPANCGSTRTSLLFARIDNIGSKGTPVSPPPQPPPIDEVLEVRIAGNQFIQSFIITFLPVVFTIVSFFTFPFTSRLFHVTVESLSDDTWHAVDGGALQWEVLLPALNGVVMTAISILFANLISTTFITLRNRQLAVHSSLNSETEDIRGLILLIDYYPESMRELFKSCLRRYILMVVEELQPDIDIAKVRVSSNFPILDFLNNLHDLLSNEDDGRETMNPMILQQSYDSLQRIIAWRTNRVTALQSTFPALHYMTIASLIFAMLVVFLIETDRDLILFLNNFQIRLIWSMLIGTFTAIYCIGYDLANPFLGTYQVKMDVFGFGMLVWMYGFGCLMV